jgi:acetolactate synthase-1/2/3 large subunit
MGLSGGGIVCETLARYGTRTAFALAGAGHTHLLDALDRKGFRIVSARHESGAIAAADGYARVSGRIGIALTITDQGLPNAIAGLACAYHACSPLIVLMARLPDAWIEPEAEHDSLSLALLRPVTKWCRTVPAAGRLAEYVDVACRRALAGRPGPVVLQVPQEFLAQKLELPRGGLQPIPEIALPHPDPAAIERAADLIVAARRPLVVTGAGATRGQAETSLRTASEEFGLPVVGNSLGRGVVAEDWRLGFSWPLAQSAAHEADVVLVLGARLKQRLGYGLPPRFSATARFIQVDVEAEELSRNRRIDVPIVAGAGQATAALLRKLRDRRYAGAPEPGWLRQALAPRLDYLDRLAAQDVDPIHPLRLGRELARHLPSDAIVVGDGADIQNWMYGALRVQRAPGFLDHYPLGAMGVGTPLAVGAAAAARELAETTGVPERRVVLVTGDGALGFHPAEIHAVALAGLPLVTVVGNDGAWGTELHGQQQAIGRDLNTALGAQRWDRLAEIFGCHGERVERLAALAPALERAFAARAPSIVDVAIDPQSGAALKAEPLARMIVFDDLVTGLATQQGIARS